MFALPDPAMWSRLHGASTHFPIALLIAGLFADGLALLLRNPDRRRDLHGAGYWMIIVGGLGAIPAVASGLLMTKGDMWGHGALLWHHIFVWPAFAALIAGAAWRARVGTQLTFRTLLMYLAAMGITAGLMSTAGYWGGELLLGSTAAAVPANTATGPTPGDVALITLGRQYYSASCAHCHAEDASGDEGPDLRSLTISPARISSVITNGIKGEMPAFAKKYNANEVAALVAYLRSLKK